MPYQEGKIVAKGFKEGKEAAQYELKTAGKPFRLLLQADREELAADGQDLLHLSIQLIDEKGVLVPNADRTIEVEVSGNGVLKGVDNGDLRREGSYGGNRIKTYFGRALVTFQAARNPGELTIRVKAVDIPESVLSVKCR